MKKKHKQKKSKHRIGDAPAFEGQTETLNIVEGQSAAHEKKHKKRKHDEEKERKKKKKEKKKKKQKQSPEPPAISGSSGGLSNPLMLGQGMWKCWHCELFFHCYIFMYTFVYIYTDVLRIMYVCHT